MYTYTAKAIRVIDGDTVKLEVDCGFRLKFTDNFRLLGINSPEITGVEKSLGLEAKWCLEELLFSITGEPYPLYIETIKPDKFGRWLVNIWVQGTDYIQEKTINQIMINSGHAVSYMPL